MNPWDSLDRFEAQHGSFATLLDRYVTAPDGSSEQTAARRLLRRHDQLVHQVVGFQMAARKAKNEQERRTSNE